MKKPLTLIAAAIALATGAWAETGSVTLNANQTYSGVITTSGFNPYADSGFHITVTGVSLDQTTASLHAGETVTLTPTVSPDNATDKTVTWASSDESVATVSDAGVVTAVTVGTATITVTTTDGSFTATCSVTERHDYDITISDGDVDKAHWSVSPNPAKQGETITIKYDGTRKIKSIKVTKKSAAQQ